MRIEIVICQKVFIAVSPRFFCVCVFNELGNI
jgi:hypothetical protein